MFIHEPKTAPIAPQTWHFRQSVDYSMTANYAVLDFAQRYRETLLYNIYVMGRNAIRRGTTDTWTDYPRRVAEVKAEIAKDMKLEAGDPRMVAGGRAQTVPAKYFQLLRKPEWRDARAYVLPADQGDFLTSTKFVNALIKAGVTVHRATAPFSAGGKQYAAGSYVVKAAQAFRPHVLDMFEPQDHPNDVQYPGGPPIPPYDNAGWTLAFQMGATFVISVPRHNLLAAGFDAAVIDSLVATNWIRTIAWTARAGLAAWFLARLTRAA